MDEEGFYSYLRKGGRKEAVARKIIKLVKGFESYLQEEQNGKSLDQADPADVLDFVEHAEQSKKDLGKKYLYGSIYYYAFNGNDGMKQAAGQMREERIERSSFPLKDFMGVNEECVSCLKAVGIRNSSQMLAAGKTPIERSQLADSAGIPVEVVEELVKLSDLARIPGVKGVRARLNYDSGVDTLDKLADWEPMALSEMLVDYVERTDFKGIATLLKEAEFTEATAKKLLRIMVFKTPHSKRDKFTHS